MGEEGVLDYLVFDFNTVAELSAVVIQSPPRGWAGTEIRNFKLQTR